MIEKFLNFEMKNKLFTKKINDINFWHIIRFQVYQELNSQLYKIDNAHNVNFARGSIRHLITKMKQLKYLFQKNIFLEMKGKEVLIFNHPRRVLDSGLYRCLYTSNLASDLNESYLMIENPHNLKHYTPIPEKNILYSDVVSLRYNFKKAQKKITGKKLLNKQERRYVSELVSKINKEFSVNFNHKNFISKVEDALLLYEVNYSLYKKVLEQVRPKIIIELVSYANNLYEINKVAKDLGIPTVELQHGTMGNYHIAYNFAEKMQIDTFPDYVFTFGDYWKDNTRLPINDSNIISVGWPYYEEKIKNQEKIKNDNITILFISQGTIGKQLSKIAKHVEECLKLENYRIIYKLHPGEYSVWKDNYPWLVNSNIEVIDHNTYDMHYYFNQADIQIGVYSTAIFEGLGYELETYIIKLYGYRYMQDLYVNDYVTLVESAQELISYIRNNTFKRENLDIGYFWESNSMSKMLTEIEKIADANFRNKDILED